MQVTPQRTLKSQVKFIGLGFVLKNIKGRGRSKASNNSKVKLPPFTLLNGYNSKPTSYLVPLCPKVNAGLRPKEPSCVTDGGSLRDPQLARYKEQVSMSYSVPNRTSRSYPFSKAQGPSQKKGQRDSKSPGGLEGNCLQT